MHSDLDRAARSIALIKSAEILINSGSQRWSGPTLFNGFG
jgi:hypothetical protein